MRCFFFVALLACAACDHDSPGPQSYYPAPLPDPRPPSSAATDAPAQDVAVGVDGDSYADTDPSALTDFHESLDAHGTWVDDDQYGTVWSPNATEVGPDFSPYVTSGHWVYDDDYVWVSDYPWGWAPFHYGRWAYLDGRGWFWVPGRRYAGAWVTWRTGEPGYAYVGWAPMGPRWGWYHGAAVGYAFAGPEPRYAFCPHQEVFVAGFGSHVVVGERAHVMVGETRVYAVRGQERAMVHGPPPASLGIEASHVAHGVPNERGVTHAQQFARPSTAQPMGAHAPTQHMYRPAPVVRRPAPPPPPARRRR